MTSELVFEPTPELARPVRFFRQALRELIRGCSIAPRLFLADLRVAHRTALLGYVWLVLPALAVAGIGLYLQRHRIVHVGHTDLPYGLHVLAGLVLWQVFLEGLASPLQQLSTNRRLITSTRVPYEALVVAGLLSVLLSAAIRTAVLLLVVVISGTGVAETAFLIPLGLCALALLGLTLGLLLAPLGLLFEDVGRALILGAGVLFFLTPIVYPTPAHGPLRLNPITPLLDATRGWLTGGAAGVGFLVVTGATLVALGAAWLLGRLARPHVVARLG